MPVLLEDTVRRTLCLVAACAALMLPAAAQAQSAYINASLTGEFMLASHIDGGDSDRPLESGGRAVGVDLRAGAGLGSAWGVEAGFLWPAAIDNESVGALASTGELSYTFNGVVGSRPSVLLPRTYRVQTSDRTTTVSAGVWARQDFTSRWAMVYIGGVGIHRRTREQAMTLDLLAMPGVVVIPGLTGIAFPAIRSEVVSYGMRPFVGAEARIGMGARLEFVAGVRVHDVSDGLIVRPSVGAGWRF